jgi:hypothetical protein
MKTARMETGAATKELNERIGKAVHYQQLQEQAAEKLKAEKAAIREIMEKAGLERAATPAGAEALLVEEERLAWHVEKLEDLLTADEFEQMCPRKATGELLRALMERDEKRQKELRACAKASKSVRLELRAAERAAEKN